MRAAIRMVCAADYPLPVAGVRAARREWWLRANRRGIEPETMAEAEARARALLADGPLRRAELVRRRARGSSAGPTSTSPPPTGSGPARPGRRRASSSSSAATWAGSGRRPSAPVRYLGTWDALLLVHARRTGVLPERVRPILFTTKTPQSLPTFRPAAFMA